MKLVWFRHDLRIADNSALHAACTGDGPVTALYVLSESQWQRHLWAPMKRAFVRAHLQELARGLAALGIPLKLLQSRHVVGQAEDVLAFAQAHAVSELYINDEYGVHEQDRDQRLLIGAQKCGIAVHRYCDHLLLPPGSVLTSAAQQPYTVYTPFKRACEARLPANIGVLPAPKKQPVNALTADPVPDHFAGEAAFDRDAWPVGEQAAMRRLLSFCKTAIGDYRDERDRPDHAGTSRLSPYLMLGVLSPRQVWQAAAAVPSEGSAGFRNELLWREFYQHLMAQIPRLSKGKPFKPDTDLLPWSYDKAAFQLWCEGSTGIPIVDAAMRCLNQTGWMHNRLRMIVASFLTKNLFIDWRWGERYFLEHLIDGEFAANNGGWQWSASTGTDAAPYFRVFNPETQAQRFDPDGVFIRTWIPELGNESARSIHLAGKRSGYPAPMVDLKQSRALAIGHFQRLSGQPMGQDQQELAL
ncbi:deoxyribodipyrimidine photo-lyase [Permianibacter sp. IMCC34836]|uniref:cryptochrome/photolyase family protein n=1 Tax=Permianibacter fluminis TaxID=2738515 RepID=UPI0015543C9C|nr:FAD-binding domain-containing protein [Permianibacter fluminis]NQD36867.1 deoxyribodipyrimidine photo-lyase [Permianibacter fluminis]